MSDDNKPAPKTDDKGSSDARKPGSGSQPGESSGGSKPAEGAPSERKPEPSQQPS